MMVLNSKIFKNTSSPFANSTASAQKRAEQALKDAKEGKAGAYSPSFLQGLERTAPGGDPATTRTQEIMDKARQGEKLTPEELEHLAKHSPENYQKAKQAMASRKMLEEQLKAAKSKEQAQSIYMAQMSPMQKNGDAMTIAQMNRAYADFMASDDFKEKPLKDEETD